MIPTAPIAAACSDLEQIEKLSKFLRYTGEDENHIAARTLPGVHSKGAFFTPAAPGITNSAHTPKCRTNIRTWSNACCASAKPAAKFVPTLLSSASKAVRVVGIVTIGGCDPW